LEKKDLLKKLKIGIIVDSQWDFIKKKDLFDHVFIFREDKYLNLKDYHNNYYKNILSYDEYKKLNESLEQYECLVLNKNHTSRNAIIKNLMICNVVKESYILYELYTPMYKVLKYKATMNRKFKIGSEKLWKHNEKFMREHSNNSNNSIGTH
jgi:hypothetical protein